MAAVNGELRGELFRHHTVRLPLDHRKQIIGETMQTFGGIVDDAELVHVVVVDLREDGVYITSSAHPYPEDDCSALPHNPSHRST